MAASNIHVCSQLLDGISQIECGAEIGDLHAAVHPALADAGIEHGGFPARVGADQQEASAASTPAMVELNR